MSRFLLLLLCVCALALPSCEDESFSSDASCRLSYSVDSVLLDTVLTDIPSPLQRVVVYNRNEENLRVLRIGISKGNRYFYLNVNGRNGNEHTNVEIMGGDSLLLYLMVGAKDISGNIATIEDALVFEYNGNRDRIPVVAVSRNAYVMRNRTIKSDTTFTAERPILVYDTLRIGEGATLRIEAGTDVFLYNKAVIVVDGSLVCDGDFAKRVRFRYYRGDDMLEGVPYYRASGNWRGVFVNSTAEEVSLRCTQIIGGEYGLVCDSVYSAERCKVRIGYSEIGYSKYGGFVASSSSVVAYSSIFANGGLYNVRLLGGEYSFIHCTIVSYNSESGIVRNPTMCIGSGDMPLALSVQNSIVYGSHKDEIKAENGSLGSEPSDDFAFYVGYSLLKGAEFKSSTVYKNRWNTDPKFKVDGSKLSYDFRIDSTNSARAMANYNIYSQCPEAVYDINGKLRLDLANDSVVQLAPDAGAYEF